jgi:hypothetical protein
VTIVVIAGLRVLLPSYQGPDLSCFAEIAFGLAGAACIVCLGATTLRLRNVSSQLGLSGTMDGGSVLLETLRMPQQSFQQPNPRAIITTSASFSLTADCSASSKFCDVSTTSS